MITCHTVIARPHNTREPAARQQYFTGSTVRLRSMSPGNGATTPRWVCTARSNSRFDNAFRLRRLGSHRLDFAALFLMCVLARHQRTYENRCLSLSLLTAASLNCQAGRLSTGRRVPLRTCRADLALSETVVLNHQPVSPAGRTLQSSGVPWPEAQLQGKR